MISNQRKTQTPSRLFHQAVDVHRNQAGASVFVLDDFPMRSNLNWKRKQCFKESTKLTLR